MEKADKKYDLIIVGAGGHGKVAADIAYLCGYKDIVFLDSNNSLIGKKIGIGSIYRLKYLNPLNLTELA